ncbi:MAG: PilW family protein [Sulfuricellaceae bacterium]|nr:PilW family protein [Sulfuricellaceae bacterium]
MNRPNKGFSLVEIMVGLGIGMLAMIVMMQVFSAFEGQKRTTTGGADAQSNGAVALYMVERDVKMAGWGMDSSIYASCNVTYSYCDGTAVCGGDTGAISDLSFASVRVTDGGANPDTLAIQYFADPDFNSFRIPANTTLRSSMPQSSSELNVTSTSGCVDGGMVLVQQGGNCTLMKITTIQGTALKIQHNPGAGGEYNPPVNFQNDNNWPAYTQGARLSCFAAAPSAAVFQRIYSVNATTRSLQKTDTTVTPVITDEAMASEIIDLQVQYGIAPIGVAPANQKINEWANATGIWANTATTPTVANWKRVKAVRVAMVARSSQYEKPDTSGVCSTTSDAAAWSTWATFNTTNYPSDWKCYRYKVFETTIPLRNILWANI